MPRFRMREALPPLPIRLQVVVIKPRDIFTYITTYTSPESETFLTLALLFAK